MDCKRVSLRQFHDVGGGIFERDELTAAGQRYRILERAGPGHYFSGFLNRSDVKHRDDNANHRRNHRANSAVESPARVIKTLLFSRYLLEFFFVPFNVFFSEPFSDELLLGRAVGDERAAALDVIAHSPFTGGF